MSTTASECGGAHSGTAFTACSLGCNSGGIVERCGRAAHAARDAARRQGPPIEDWAALRGRPMLPDGTVIWRRAR